MTYTSSTNAIYTGAMVTSPSVTFNPSTSHSHSLTTMDSAWSRTIETMMRYPQQYQAKERTMTTLEKVRAEREEARERARIEALYTAWDEADLDSINNKTVMRFEWTPKDVEYTYAVLKADDRWWATGHSANGLPTEDIIAWLIGKDIGPDDVVWLS